MKLKKIIALTLASTMVVASLAGCSSKPAGGTTTAGGETTTAGGASTAAGDTTTTASKENVELSVTTWDNTQTPQFSAIIEAYEKKNPNVKIKVMDTSADEYNNSLGVSLSAAASDPDIIWVKDMGTLLQMADKKQLLPIGDYITKDNVDLSLYKGAADQLKYNDNYYSLPYRSDWYVLYYNKDLFDAAGVEYPTNDMTWEEYYALAEKMTSGEGSSKIYGTHNHTWQALVTNWAVQDGKHTVVDKDYTFMKKAYDDAVTLQEKGFMQDYSTLKTANIHYSSVFKNQTAAMMPMGTWFIGTLIKAQKDKEIDYNWGVVKIPHGADTEAGYTVGAITPLAISATTDQADAAWDFVKFATSEEAAVELGKQGIFTCIQNEDTMKEISSAEFFPTDAESVKALEYTNFVFDRPLDPKIEEIRTVLDEVHDLIMVKELTVDEGLKQMTERVATIKGW